MKIIFALFFIVVGIGCGNNDAHNEIAKAIPIKNSSRQDSIAFMMKSLDSVNVIYDSVHSLTYRYADTCNYWLDKSREHLYTPEFNFYIAKAEKYKRKFDRMGTPLKQLWHIKDSIRNSVK